MSSLFYFVLIFTLASAKNYCSVCIDHTMCRFGNTIGRRCGHSSEGGVTDSEIQTILDLHNAYRSKVAMGKENQGTPGPQPTAANMQTLLWDRKLAEVAQRWADQCTFQHDKCRDDPRFSVGQNIYYSSSSNMKNWTRAVESWYQEVKHVNASQINNYNYQRESSHYAQLVWAKSRYIGCARRSYAGLYRPRGSSSMEYVLGEARKKNDQENKLLQKTGLYFGEEIDKIDLAAGVKGAITSKDSVNSDHQVTDTSYFDDNHLQARQQSSGFFGGSIAFNPNAAQGAVTSSSNYKKPSKPTASNVVVSTKPTYAFNYNPRPQWNIPPMAYPVYKPYYPTYSQYVSYEAAARFNHTKESRKNTSDESSEEDSSEESSEEKGNIVVPASLQFKSWTNDGWQMIDYDLSIDQIYICNYGPTGNFIDESIYTTGTPCSGCPSNSKCQHGLCV